MEAAEDVPLRFELHRWAWAGDEMSQKAGGWRRKSAEACSLDRWDFRHAAQGAFAARLVESLMGCVGCSCQLLEEVAWWIYARVLAYVLRKDVLKTLGGSPPPVRMTTE